MTSVNLKEIKHHKAIDTNLNKKNELDDDTRKDKDVNETTNNTKIIYSDEAYIQINT